jgi:hypothetical protein
MLRRCYFDVGNGHKTIRDGEGVEAEDLGQALADAYEVIGEMADDLGAADLNNPWTLIVRDETGLTVAHVPIGLFSNLHRMPCCGLASQKWRALFLKEEGSDGRPEADLYP